MPNVFARTAVGYRGDPRVAGLPLMLIAPALFAANMVAARWAESAAIPPIFLAFGRWTLAFFILLPFVAPRLWACRAVLRAAWPRILLLASLGMGVAVAPQYMGAHDTSATNVALIFAACPTLIALIEALVWRVPVGTLRAVGMSLAIWGVLLVLAKGEVAALGRLQFGRGDLWVVLAACGWALYTVLGKRRPLPTLPGEVKLSALIGGGALALAPFALLEAAGGTVADFGDGRLYAALGFLAIVPSLGAYFCYDRLVGLVGPGGASVSMYLVPLYAALAAWPLLGEVPQAFHIAGFGLILGGVLLSGLQRD
ncbi:EamA family transporter [Azoarcus sp. DD4]|uniref:DMT family transporter n=1 Tax=Azoarcus sp. DD4 TaxID=2027405 RepID=UPI00112BADB1|nr:DMT family transporter [Azoarcus sp. DD4]QDF98461.1 EamA family transporter [Azoarcus sp. DD4]